jgi:hypothetical protein
VSGTSPAQHVEVTDSLDEIYSKISPGLQESVDALLGRIPALTQQFKSAMEAQNVRWVTFSREEIMGNAVITDSSEGLGAPGSEWRATAITAGLRKFWPPKTPPRDIVDKLRIATVCYEMLELRYLNVTSRCFVEPQNVNILRSTYESE